MAYTEVFLAVLCAVGVACLSSRAGEGLYYINEWAVKIPGGERIAREVAADHGLMFDGQIGSLPDTYAFIKKQVRLRSRRAAEHLNQLLSHDHRVFWVEQQQLIVHAKKTADIVPPDETGDDWAIPFDDPLWPEQWYLYNDGQRGATPGMDMNLMPAWKLGYTGKGVVVTIVDDGVDQHHPDLKDNFDFYASFDFNNKSNRHSPHPDLSKPAIAVRHGTRCAGEVAAVADNGICGVGVAYEVGIGGIRLLDGDTTDRLTAEAIQFNNSHIDIYSCCWGPVDDGKRFEMPHRLTREAFREGARVGREGKGSIFVWASGNGGADGDHCGADGYVGDIHTISISSINDHGRPSYFVESCPANMAVTLSGGPQSREEIFSGRFMWNLVTTTDLYGNCTTAFVGTSSAAPLASGIFAIVLQANPQLTWRDLQYIVTEGCMIPQPYDGGWLINGAGLHVHHNFGFGVLDAGHMVELALTWDLVGPQRVCEVAPVFPQLALLQGHSSNLTLTVDCPCIRSLEHTLVQISFTAPRRGDISLVLYSPFGTPSQLLAPRLYDGSDEGLVDWPFMSVHNWGEDPSGDWTLTFSYNPTPDGVDAPEDEPLELQPRIQKASAVLTSWGMTVYGIEEPRRRGNSTDDGVLGGGDGENADEHGLGDEDGFENPVINPEDAGKSDQNTIVKIYNNEQLASEEIKLDPEDIVSGVPLPPNAAHNLNDANGLIETGSFDGYLLGKFGGLIMLGDFAKRMGEVDAFLSYLSSLDDRSLEILGREPSLAGIFELAPEDTEMEEASREETMRPAFQRKSVGGYGEEGHPTGGNLYQKKLNEGRTGHQLRGAVPNSNPPTPPRRGQTSEEGYRPESGSTEREQNQRSKLLQLLQSLAQRELDNQGSRVE